MNLRLIPFFLTLLSFSAFGQAINKVDAEGKRHGKWQKNYEKSNQIRYRGQFHHGKEVGLFEYFDLKKNKHPYLTRQFNDTNRIAIVSYFLPENGAIVSRGKMLDSLKIGLWVYYHKNTNDTLMIETYQDNQLTGVRKIFFPNGKPTEISYFENNLLQGKTETFDEEGDKLSELHYKDGLLDGKAVYFKEGKIIIEGQYKEDKRVGTWYYYDDGVLIETKHF
ncbi:MAG: hypothetical protein RQ735_07160 [Flavobacteriaceae bacterium]|nr:hypothetical protein [Flavobacteriaceae bacterium]